MGSDGEIDGAGMTGVPTDGLKMAGILVMLGGGVGRNCQALACNL